MLYFQDKDKSMLENTQWPEIYEETLDMSRVSMDVITPWITQRLTELVGYDDDILIDFCLQQLSDRRGIDGEIRKICPKTLHMSLIGFAGAKRAAAFVRELWTLLLSAQNSADGIPKELLGSKICEVYKKKTTLEENRRKLENLKHKIQLVKNKERPYDQKKTRSYSKSPERRRSHYNSVYKPKDYKYSHSSRYRKSSDSRGRSKRVYSRNSQDHVRQRYKRSRTR